MWGELKSEVVYCGFGSWVGLGFEVGLFDGSIYILIIFLCCFLSEFNKLWYSYLVECYIVIKEDIIKVLYVL